MTADERVPPPRERVGPPRENVLALCEPGRAGGAVLDLARELAEDEGAELTVVAVAPHAPSGARCGNSAIDYNEAVADSVARELDQARERLGLRAAARATFTLLREGSDPSLREFAQTGGFDLVLLPAVRRPFRGAYHPEARPLGRLTGAEIRIVDRRGAGAVDRS